MLQINTLSATNNYYKILYNYITFWCDEGHELLMPPVNNSLGEPLKNVPNSIDYVLNLVFFFLLFFSSQRRNDWQTVWAETNDHRGHNRYRVTGNHVPVHGRLRHTGDIAIQWQKPFSNVPCRGRRTGGPWPPRHRGRPFSRKRVGHVAEPDGLRRPERVSIWPQPGRFRSGVRELYRGRIDLRLVLGTIPAYPAGRCGQLWGGPVFGSTGRTGPRTHQIRSCPGRGECVI